MVNTNFEIERKWLFDGDLDFITANCKCAIISDFYFNKNTRLRNINNGEWRITIKGDGTLVRNEFEVPIALKDLPNQTLLGCLQKKRYYVDYHGNTFEINVFQNRVLNNLVLVECELGSLDVAIDLPDWLGKDVTENREYYGYNLFQKIAI